ncbi:hypothetical protein [Paenibacillus aestuarii]|uniref:Uncharacterized protein n=1 Tax=Paenibacillus aestuarii TaxID=516965 RepID=A0ABW0KDJ5_9BACL|nr:hypothetical protein [Paenibacillus aestuarii]
MITSSTNRTRTTPAEFQDWTIALLPGSFCWLAGGQSVFLQRSNH